MKGFVGVPYYCLNCMVGYTASNRHKCPEDDSCDDCRRPMEDHKRWKDENGSCKSVSCENCLRVFVDADCFKLHKNWTCKKSWICPKCKFKYPQKHPKESHKCYETKCGHCGEYDVKKDHLCFIQPEKAWTARRTKPCIPTMVTTL